MDVTKGVKMKDKRNGGILLRSLLLLGAGGLCILYYLLGGILRSFKLSAFWIWLAAGVALMALGFLDRKMAQTGRTWFKGRRSRRAACILAAFVLLYFGVVEAMVFTGVVSRGDPGLHYLIVLGAGVYGEEPSPALRSRTETAIRYLNENPDTKAVLSGGQGPGEDISEAECMARLMRESGISEARIIKEEHSTTTVENIKNSYEIIGSTDLKVGIVGIGVSGGMIADAMRFMGADVSYYSRTRKAERESQGMTYRPLKELLEYSEVVFACLNKNVILLHEEEFKQLGTGKLLFNTSIGPAFDIPALGEWLDQEGNYFICDTEGALGDPAGELLKHPHVVCAHGSAGRTRQAFDLLSKKVLDNLRTFLGA